MNNNIITKLDNLISKWDSANREVASVCLEAKHEIIKLQSVIQVHEQYKDNYRSVTGWGKGKDE
jgi:hypothetical protein